MDDIRRQLHDRLEELTRRQVAVNKHLRHADGRNDEDWTDRAALMQNDEVLEGLEVDAREETLQIQRALARIDAGQFAVCVDCDEEIPLPRLRALPFATQCVACAAASGG